MHTDSQRPAPCGDLSRRPRNPDRDLYDGLETVCSPVKTVWRETSELWDLVCYGVGSLYWRLFRR